MTPLVRYEVTGRIARITLNRPDKRNALNAEVVEGLREALSAAEADARVRVVTLAGAGKAFSAGADLAALEAMQRATPMENLADSQRLAAVFDRIYRLDKPVIAKIKGAAVAGGCGLAAVCDIAVAAEDARFGFTEVRIGFVPAIVAVFLVRKLGEAAARDLLLRGRLVDASYAREIGLVAHTAPPDRVDEAAEAIAQELATETSGSAVLLTKQLLARVQGMALGEALDYAAQVNAFARGSKDCQDGIAAFLGKTPPPWKSGEP